MKVSQIPEGRTGINLLQNDGRLEVIWAGVGAARAKKHFQNNFLVVKGNDHVMVDMGITAPMALWQQFGLEIGAVDNLLVTHSHSDHIGGIESFALDTRYVLRKKPTLIVTPEYQRVLWENSLRGGLEYNERNEEGHRLELVDYFNVLNPTWKTHSPREIWEVNIGTINLEIFRTLHTPEQSSNWQESFLSYGVMIDGRVFVSCDTQFDLDLIETYCHAETMFHDAQFFPGAVHAPLADLHTLPADIKEKMLLMHMADNWMEQNIDGFAGWTQQGVIYRWEP
jgi:ribonuclease BN (tRNA processing enzyme)